jgi:hypothetical protein
MEAVCSTLSGKFTQDVPLVIHPSMRNSVFVNPVFLFPYLTTPPWNLSWLVVSRNIRLLDPTPLDPTAPFSFFASFS